MATEFYFTLIIVYAMFVIIEFAYLMSKFNATDLVTKREKVIFAIAFILLLIFSPIVVLVHIGDVLFVIKEAEYDDY